RASRELVVLVDALLPELLQPCVLLLPADVEAAAVVRIGEGVHGGAVLVALDDLARRHLYEILVALRTVRGARLEAGLLEQDFGIRGFLAMDGGACGQREKRDGKEDKSHACVSIRWSRDGGAMNSGPTGSVIRSRSTRSISALTSASSDQPFTSATGASWLGWRAPHSAVVMPWSSIQRTARWMTRLP